MRNDRLGIGIGAASIRDRTTETSCAATSEALDARGLDRRARSEASGAKEARSIACAGGDDDSDAYAQHRHGDSRRARANSAERQAKKHEAALIA
jgi:hypothetical protein